MAKRPSFFHHLHPPKIPAREARFRYTFGLGGMSAYLFAVLLVTGVLEVMYYVPSAADANRSLQTITLVVPYGGMVRSLHYWSAQFLVVTAVLHLLRVALTGAYKSQRRFNWLLGLSLLVLVLLFDFTGYALRWDEEIAWALLVGTNLLRSVPLIGRSLYSLAVGSASIGEATVVRMYGWHVFGLSLAAALLLGWHLFRVRRDGGISRSADSRLAPRTVHRDELVRREMLALLALTIILLVVSLLFPPGLGAAADFQAIPAEATAPWFFLWIQQLLRYGPPLWMGVLIPLAILLILALLPYAIDRSQEGTGEWFNREGRMARLFVLTIMVFVLSFILQGAWQ